MTSYQIKSTPFFRRMLSTSKKNGQLQRLKDEYERIKDFNDRTIELRMRQLRLKRLYKEIDDIRESTMSIYNRQRSQNVERRKTAEELRHEAITRSKELGNMFMYERQYMSMPSHFQVSPEFEAQVKEYQKVKQRIVKSIDYGNEISRCNMRKMKEKKSRTNTTTGTTNGAATKAKASASTSVTATATTTTLVPTAYTTIDSISNSISNKENNELSGDKNKYNNSNGAMMPWDGNELDSKSSCTKHMHCEEMRQENRAKRSQLKQRLQYGNSWSSQNLSKIQKRNQRHNVINEPEHTTPRAHATVAAIAAKAQTSPPPPPKLQGERMAPERCVMSDEHSSIAVKLMPLEQSARYLQALEELQQAQAQMRAVTTTAATAGALPEEDTQERARRHWRKVGLAVRSRSDEWRNRKLQQHTLQKQQQQRLQYHHHQQHQQQQQQQPNDDATPLAKAALPLHLNQEQLHQQLLMKAVATSLPLEVEHELDSESALETADEYLGDGDDDELGLPPPPPPLDDNDIAATNAMASDDIPLPPPSASEYGENLDLPELATKAHHFIRPYESLLRSTAAKEAVEYTVQNLRHIFEHKH